ncbi:hypothetical protein TRAPUB_8468 [Trametes pubescens]|uniref:Uncharacterized protein n=1 Tax=Trametes pubescens TaxID=154538 RepID=A0A1M2W586_TRAPU|nr:hypothetical protein TRAPUB_8468 [Trametes pubescens]
MKSKLYLHNNHLPTVEFLALFAFDGARRHVSCTELLNEWRRLGGLASPGGDWCVPLRPMLTTLALECRGETCSPDALDSGGEILAAMGLAEARAAVGIPLVRLRLCVDEDRDQEGRVVSALRKYDGEGRLIGTDASKEPTRVLERL